MPLPREPSVEELRQQSEQSRAALATTIGELRERVGDSAAELKTLVAPDHIKQQLKDFVRDERESLVNSVRRRVQENPLQVAAIGAAIAYPAWGLLRAIPTPLLLIGAGLFLTSKKGQQAAKDAKARIDEAVQQGSERVADMATGIQSDLQDRIDGAKHGLEEIRDTVSSAAGSVVGKAQEQFHDASDAVKHAARGVAHDASVAADRAYATAANSGEGIKERAGTTAIHSRDAVITFVNENPLLVAGIGAAIGAFIAASMPSSDAENRLFGAGSEKLKTKAKEVAAQSIEMAGDVAAEAAASVATAAAREGLDATGVRQTLNKVAESVRAVADRGIDTALESAPQPSQQTFAERNQS